MRLDESLILDVLSELGERHARPLTALLDHMTTHPQCVYLTTGLLESITSSRCAIVDALTWLAVHERGFVTRFQFAQDHDMGPVEAAIAMVTGLIYHPDLGEHFVCSADNIEMHFAPTQALQDALKERRENAA